MTSIRQGLLHSPDPRTACRGPRARPGPAAAPLAVLLLAPLCPVSYEGSPAVNRDDHATFPQQLHGRPHGDVGDSILFRQISFCPEFAGDLTSLDPALYVVCYLDVGVLDSVGINLPGWHKIIMHVP